MISTWCSTLFSKKTDPLAVVKSALLANAAGGPGFMMGFVGSSITKGYGADSGDGTENTDGFNRGRVAKVAAGLAAAGYSVTMDSVWGTSNRPGDYFAYNDRITGGGSGTSWVSGFQSVGGPCWRNSTNANPMVFTPRLQVDTIDMYFPIETSLGTISYIVDGGAATNVVLTGASALRKITLNLTKGFHNVSLQRVSGLAYWIGIDAYDSTARQIRMCNLGWGSTTTPNWATSTAPYSPSPMLASLPFKYVDVELGINDLDTTTLPNYQTALQTVFTAAKAQGASLNFEATHNISGTVAAANCRTFNDAGIALALANGGSYIDQQVRFVDYNTAASNGYMADGVHHNESGYTFRAIPTIAKLLAA